MRLTAVLAGERIARKSTTSVGVVRRPAEHDGIQLDDEDGTFLSRGLLEAALSELQERQLLRMAGIKGRLSGLAAWLPKDAYRPGPPAFGIDRNVRVSKPKRKAKKRRRR